MDTKIKWYGVKNSFVAKTILKTPLLYYVLGLRYLEVWLVCLCLFFCSWSLLYITAHCTTKITPVSSKLLVSRSMYSALENTSPLQLSGWSGYKNSYSLFTAVLPAKPPPIPSLATYLLFLLMVLFGR